MGQSLNRSIIEPRKLIRPRRIERESPERLQPIALKYELEKWRHIAPAKYNMFLIMYSASAHRIRPEENPGQVDQEKSEGYTGKRLINQPPSSPPCYVSAGP